MGRADHIRPTLNLKWWKDKEIVMTLLHIGFVTGCIVTLMVCFCVWGSCIIAKRDREKKEVYMSEWYEIKNQEDIEISKDGKVLEVLFNSNQFGNQYIEIPIKFITNILTHKNKHE